MLLPEPLYLINEKLLGTLSKSQTPRINIQLHSEGLRRTNSAQKYIFNPLFATKLYVQYFAGMTTEILQEINPNCRTFLDTSGHEPIALGA